MEFKKMLFANPQEALGQFGFVIPGSSGDGRNYLETLNAVFSGQIFINGLTQKILSEFRDETIKMTPGPFVTATEHRSYGLEF